MAKALADHWAQRELSVSLLPPEAVLTTLLDVLYQASLLREEGDPVRCRVLFAKPDELTAYSVDEVSRLRVLPFAEPALLTPNNLRKLSAAAGFYRALMAVHMDEDGSLAIWGMVFTGTEWVNQVEGCRFEGVPLPPNLVIQASGPGHLIAAAGYSRVLETKNGQLLTEGFDPFQSEWLPERFNEFRRSLLQQLPKARANDHATQICNSFVRDAGQSVVRRVLRLVRDRRHGGMLVFLPDDPKNSNISSQWLRFRVQFKSDNSNLLYRRLILRLLNRALEVGRSRGMDLVTWGDYQRLRDDELTHIDDALIEFGHLLADMMNIDGALVLDRSFRLLGFGGEILGEKPVLQIHRALDLEANRSIVEPGDSAGTRHRSAYRLVNGLREAIAVVISQDGDVRFVAHHLGKLTYWPYLP
ncbi:Uncharacterized protein SCF082_LOCUS42316 [Durusdinium trenchii]|uniref:Probable sensor domain-containing protein n=1 Tax=Durusdinium trenchii TaxID=1381693 RepID=A0ABP0QKN2_9DINO